MLAVMSKFKRNALTASLALSLIVPGAVYANVHTAHNNDAASVMPDISQKKVLVGYWHNWPDAQGYKLGKAPFMALTDVPQAYNVVMLSFMKVNEGQADRIPTFKPYNSTDENFRAEVGQLNSQGRAVLLSLGGADAHIALSAADKEAFKKEIIRLVDTYGVDGVDIDLEQSAISAADNNTVIPAALKEVKDYYKAQGKHFIISMAPEFPHLHQGGPYSAYINSLEGYYDFIAPQYYNQGGDGVWVDEINKWVAQGDNNTSAADKETFLFYLTDSLVNGTRSFLKIPADKFVIGLPSNIDAAASGYVANSSSVFNALSRLKEAGEPIKGLMTWSINWDTGKNSAGQSYGYEFLNRYQSILDDAPPGPVTDTVAPTAPAQLTAAVEGKTISLIWKASTDNVGVAKYLIYRNDNHIASTTGTAWQDTSAVAGVTYRYHVLANDAAGNSSPASNSVQAKVEDDKPGTEKPQAPTQLRLIKTDKTTLDISWAPVTNVPIKQYRVYRNASQIAAVTGTSLQDAGLAPGTQYRYTVVAEGKNLQLSPQSAPLNATTKADDKPIPGSDEWKVGTTYKPGDVVRYKGKTYRCLQGHPAMEHWNPAVAASLWQVM